MTATTKPKTMRQALREGRAQDFKRALNGRDLTPETALAVLEDGPLVEAACMLVSGDVLARRRREVIDQDEHRTPGGTAICYWADARGESGEGYHTGD